MKVFKKELFFLLIVICSPLAASPFDITFSDWSYGESGLCTKGEMDNLQYVVEKLRKKIGIKSPVEVVQGEDCALLNWCENPVDKHDGISKPHVISLDAEHTALLKEEPCFGFFSRKNRKPEYYKAVGVLCHELGHAKQSENFDWAGRLQLLFKKREECLAKMKDNLELLSKEAALKESEQDSKKVDYLDKTLCEMEASLDDLGGKIDQLRHEAEIDADAAVPNEKRLLQVLRDSFAEEHAYLCSKSERLKMRWKIDFTQHVDELVAQEIDNQHRSDGDYHPSPYRRAYMFNERLKVLEA